MKYFCLHPFISLAIEPSGAIRTCCVTKNKLGDAKNGDTVSSVWNGSKLNKIREEIINGKASANCLGCIYSEQFNHRSKRLRSNDTWEKIIKKKSIFEIADIKNFNKNYIQHLDLSLSNSCNLNCAMCFAEFSTAWQNYKNDLAKEKFKFIHNYQTYEKATGLSNYFIDDLVKYFPRLQRISIKGGEPLLDRKLRIILRKLIEANKEIKKIIIVTNGTVINNEVISAISIAKNISLSISIDARGKLYEWIRGYNFNKLMSNISRFSKINSIKEINITHTLSVYNIWEVNNFIDWFLSIKKNSLYNNKIRSLSLAQNARQKHVSVRNILFSERDREAEKIRKKIKSIDTNALWGAQNILASLAEPEYSLENKKNFIAWTDKMNQIRGFSIYDIVPELRHCIFPNK